MFLKVRKLSPQKVDFNILYDDEVGIPKVEKRQRENKLDSSQNNFVVHQSLYGSDSSC